MEEPVPVWRERRGRLSAYRGPAQPPVQPGPGSRRGRCARRTRSRALGGTELHPERHRAGHAQTRARGPRLWLPARARPRSRLLEVFAFAFLPMSLRKMKVVVSRTGAAAVPGEGRRMRRRPAWSAGPGAPAQGEVAAHPGPPGSPEDGQQRNKKMDSLAAGELNASHQPWVPEFVAHWRKTHQGTEEPLEAGHRAGMDETKANTLLIKLQRTLGSILCSILSYQITSAACTAGPLDSWILERPGR
ncbi:uncharacterized protein CARINH isoform X2 [Macaca mulatta]|nr:uncharacterized protein C5orf56 homolog isoform X2 [Macaca mulatta]